MICGLNAKLATVDLPAAASPDSVMVF